jgi:NADH:ubiquinone oxidoreductase subunit F (NADH-binding)
LPRLLANVMTPHPLNLDEHLREYGPVPLPGRGSRHDRAGFIDLVERAGLTGRGGAGFPTATKLRAVASGGGDAAVVANGAEGEPASFKDRLLLTRLPHLVLDGIALAAAAVRARDAYLCVHHGQQDVLAALQTAVRDRKSARADPVKIRVTQIPARYVSSEQSAIVHYLNGGPATPTFSPPRTHESGVHGRPTLVNNVETLANLALIARYGDRWFRGVGLPSAPGSTLLSVGGAVCKPGIYEIALGTTIGQVLTLAGLAEPLQAVLTGGYFGSWLRADVAWQVPMTHADLRAAGGALGAGVLIALPASSCGLAETARVLGYLAGETAGQCGPCVMGLPALAGAVEDLAYRGGRDRQRDRVTRFQRLVDGRGACRHPDGASQFAASALAAFSADACLHEEHGPCAGLQRAPLLPLPAEDEPWQEQQ